MYAYRGGKNLILVHIISVITPTLHYSQIRLSHSSSFGPVLPLKHCYLCKPWKEILFSSTTIDCTLHICDTAHCSPV